RFWRGAPPAKGRGRRRGPAVAGGSGRSSRGFAAAAPPLAAVLEELHLPQPLFRGRLRVVRAEFPPSLLGEHHVLAALLLDHHITSLRLALQLCFVSSDEGAEVVGQ